MGALGVVGDEIFIEHGLHLVNGLEPSSSAFDPEVLVEKGALGTSHESIGLGRFTRVVW